MDPAIKNWWGRDGLAHYVAVLSTMRTACGRTLAHREHGFTRFDTTTGEPWPKCGQCQRSREQHSAKLSGPPSGNVRDSQEKP